MSRQSERAESRFDPAIESAGLTVDTPAGPVDLVAVERARVGYPVSLTRADRKFLFAELRPVLEDMIPAAAALGVDPFSVQRAVIRRRAEIRACENGAA